MRSPLNIDKNAASASFTFFENVDPRPCRSWHATFCDALAGLTCKRAAKARARRRFSFRFGETSPSWSKSALLDVVG